MTEQHRHFHDELAKLKEELVRMSSIAQDSLNRAVQAVIDRDAAQVSAVRKTDQVIDQLELEIDSMVMSLLALQQPMAGDLRLILAALKISNDLERVGDHAVNIAQSAKRLAKSQFIAPKPELVESARLAREMLSNAISAFVRGDPQAGREVCKMDDLVDDLHRSMFRILLTHMAEDHHTIGAAMELFLVSKNLERVADLATNIAEEVVFLVEGTSIKHHAEE